MADNKPLAKTTGNAPDKAFDPVNMPITAEGMRTLIKAAVSKTGTQQTKEEKIEQAKLLVKIFEGGMIPKEAMKISDKELASLYSFAFELAKSGKYAEARELFKYLCMLDPTESDFALSLGVCHHHLKDYKFAATAYMLASALNFDDPVPYFYAYDCCMQLKNPVSAAIMLQNVIDKAGDDAKYAQMKQRAKVLLDELQQPGGKTVATEQKNASLESMQG